MPTYDVTGHPLLSDAAQALRSSELEAQADAAEEVLGIAGTSYSGDDETRLLVALARQVNHQVALDGAGAAYLVSESKGSQSRTYRAGGSGSVMTADPIAIRIARAVLGTGAWDDVRAVR